MSTYLLYDFLDNRGNNAIGIWIDSLEKTERQRINTRIAMLGASGADLPPKLLSDTSEPHIKKLRVNGRVAVRLFLCKGPIDKNKEFTFLFGTTEKDNKTVDRNAAERAEEWRNMIISDPTNRRCLHEKVC